ncbi:hypothetical protein C8R43DRAFT_1116418 [Mycena crocata]|nr:hypothetical protein C8R43DRAFT_1116418 [Mycena crocata]
MLGARLRPKPRLSSPHLMPPQKMLKRKASGELCSERSTPEQPKSMEWVAGWDAAMDEVLTISKELAAKDDEDEFGKLPPDCSWDAGYDTSLDIGDTGSVGQYVECASTMTQEEWSPIHNMLWDDKQLPPGRRFLSVEEYAAAWDISDNRRDDSLVVRLEKIDARIRSLNPLEDIDVSELRQTRKTPIIRRKSR